MENSQTAISILTFLNNINELIVISNNRSLALEVMRSLVVYAKNHSFKLPTERITNFQRICLDSRANVLSSILSEIANEVVMADKKAFKSNLNKSKAKANDKNDSLV